MDQDGKKTGGRYDGTVLIPTVRVHGEWKGERGGTEYQTNGSRRRNRLTIETESENEGRWRDGEKTHEKKNPSEHAVRKKQ